MSNSRQALSVASLEHKSLLFMDALARHGRWKGVDGSCALPMQKSHAVRVDSPLRLRFGMASNELWLSRAEELYVKLAESVRGQTSCGCPFVGSRDKHGCERVQRCQGIFLNYLTFLLPLSS